MVGGVGLTGCSSRVVSMNNPIAITAEEYDRVFEAAVDVLRLNEFVVNRQDRRFGIITTEPYVAGSLLEPWRTDNTTAYQWSDATLNYQRRIVNVHLEPAVPAALAAAELNRVAVRRGEAATEVDDEQVGEVVAQAVGESPESEPPPATTYDGQTYQLRVVVDLEQRQVPEQQLHTAAMSSETYYGRSPDVRSTVTEEGRELSFWKPIGRDIYYEQRLVQEILNRSTFISPRFKSTEGPTDEDASPTPVLIRPSDVTAPDEQPTPESNDAPSPEAP